MLKPFESFLEETMALVQPLQGKLSCKGKTTFPGGVRCSNAPDGRRMQRSQRAFRRLSGCLFCSRQRGVFNPWGAGPKLLPLNNTCSSMHLSGGWPGSMTDGRGGRGVTRRAALTAGGPPGLPLPQWPCQRSGDGAGVLKIHV